MRRGIFTCGLTALGLLLASSGASSACGGAFMQAFFFQKNPQAKSVSKAVRDALDQGVLEGERWEKSKGISRHAWRSQKVEATIGVLQDHLNAATLPPDDVSGFHVFLIHEFAWLDVISDGQKVNVTRTSVGPAQGIPRIFTTRQVLDNLLNGKMTFEQALDDGLIASTCATQCAAENMLKYALTSAPKSQQSGGS